MARSCLPGPAALGAYVDAHHAGSVSAFAAEKKLDRVQVLRVLNGTRGGRMTVKLAAALEAATEGAVPMSLWAEASTGGEAA